MKAKATRAPSIDQTSAASNCDFAGQALDIQSLALAGKALFEQEDDGCMPDLGRLLGVIAERSGDLYAELAVKGGAAIGDPGPVMDPKMDAGTISDTLRYAQQDDAGPDRVLLELVQVIKPYCQSGEARAKLPDLLLTAGQAGT